MDRAYREDELLESTVIDSEGYIYGKVEKINVGEEKITLVVYESKPDTKTMTDVNNLKLQLLKNISLPLGAKIQGLSPIEILMKNIRKELGLKPQEHITNEHYEEYAKRLGIPILQKKIETERKEPKGEVSIEEVKTIKVSMIGTEYDQKVVKIILLNDPREAMFRNIPIQEKIPYRSSEVIKDKLVLDSDGVALGFVDSVVLFRNGPGIRVYLSKTTGRVDLNALNKYLDITGKPHIANLIRGYFLQDTINREALEDFLQKARLTLTLPENCIISKNTKEFLMDVPWDLVQKVGDVVILRLTSLDLQSKGYLTKGRT